MATKTKSRDEEFKDKQMLAELEEEAARTNRRVRDLRGKMKAGAAPEMVEGKAYYVIKAPHYRQGVLYPAGTVVCVEDEAPSKTWRRVKPVRGAKTLPKLTAEPVPEETEENEEIVPLEVGEGKPNPGGVSPAVMNTATKSVTVPTTPAEVPAAKKDEKDDKARPHDKKL